MTAILEDPKTKYPQVSGQQQERPGYSDALTPAADYGENTYKGSGKLLGRKALITGADSGIGRAVALAFAREGADVAIAYYDEHEDAKETERLVVGAGRRALLLPGDLADPTFCEAIVTKTVDEFGRLDILVNNAAHQGKSVESFADLTVERVERT